MTMSAKPTSEARAEIAERLRTIMRLPPSVDRDLEAAKFVYANRYAILDIVAPPHPAAPADAGDAVRVVEALEKIVYAADAYNQEAAVETAKEEATAALAAARRLLDAPPGVPKTADGVPIVPGMSVWHPDFEYSSQRIGDPCGHFIDGNMTWYKPVGECYSTRAAALAVSAAAGSVATGEGGT